MRIIVCDKCKEEKKYYAKNMCKKCHNSKYHEKNKEKIKKRKQKNYLKTRKKDLERNKIWYKNNKEEKMIKNRDRYWVIKQQVISFYSNNYMKCSLCDIDDMDILSIDHIDGDGHSERIKLFGRRCGGDMYKHLIDNNFPDGYRVLCRNCNWKEYLLKKDGNVEKVKKDEDA